MKQLNTDCLRHNLRPVIGDVEQVLHSMSDATGEQVGDLKSRAGRPLHDVRDPWARWSTTQSRRCSAQAGRRRATCETTRGN